MKKDKLHRLFGFRSSLYQTLGILFLSSISTILYLSSSLYEVQKGIATAKASLGFGEAFVIVSLFVYISIYFIVILKLRNKLHDVRHRYLKENIEKNTDITLFYLAMVILILMSINYLFRGIVNLGWMTLPVLFALIMLIRYHLKFGKINFREVVINFLTAVIFTILIGIFGFVAMILSKLVIGFLGG